MNRAVWIAGGAVLLGAGGYWLYSKSRKSSPVLGPQSLDMSHEASNAMKSPASPQEGKAPSGGEGVKTPPSGGDDKTSPQDDGCLPGETVLMCTIRKQKEEDAKVAAAQQAAHDRLIKISSAYAPGIYPGAGTASPSSSGSTRFL